MTRRYFSVVWLILATSFVPADEPAPPSAPTAIQSALKTAISCDFNNTPLSQVIEFFRDQTGVNILLDLNGLDIAGVDADKPISFTVKDIAIQDALYLILRPLELTTIEKNGVLLVTDADDTGAELVTKTYPVSDIVAVKGKDGKTLFIAQETMQVIQATVAQDSWEENGGVGTLDWIPSRGLLVVSQSRAVHERIEQFLADIRSTKSQSIELVQKVGFNDLESFAAEAAQAVIADREAHEQRISTRERERIEIQKAQAQLRLIELQVEKTKLEIEMLRSGKKP